jgi:CheY-like chemotaxis protein
VAAKPQPPEPEQEVTRGQGVILLAEDDDQVRRFAVRVIEEAGYRVITARDGEEAVAQFRAAADRIRLVIADVVMPKLDGRALYEAVAADRPDMPVLFCSGYSFGPLRPEDFPGGNVDLIEKPFRPRDLLRKIDQLLKKHT